MRSTATLNNALYTVTGAPDRRRQSTSPIDLRFEYRDSAGLHAVKEFQLRARRRTSSRVQRR